MALVPQEARVWSRLRLDREPTDLEPDDLAYAMNVDLYLEPGTIRSRRGRTALSAVGSEAVRLLAKVDGVRYQVAGRTLYRNGAAVLATLAGLQRTALQPSRPLNDTTTWAFIADADGMWRADGTAHYAWGITAPTTAPTLGATGTGLTGNYYAQYTYVRKVGDAVIAESNPSPLSVVQTLANQALTVAVAASADPQVTHIRLYRTTAGGALPLYDQEATNTTATLTSSQSDTALGAACATDNDPPPACGYVSPPYLDRYWLCGDPDFPHYLYYTKRFQPEAVPAANYLELGTPDDPLQCFIPFGGIGVAFGWQRKYRIIGTGTTSFLPHETPGKRGTLTPTSAVAGEDGIYFVAKDGVFRTTGFSADEQLAGPILPLFQGESRNGYDPINLTEGTGHALAIWKGRLYYAYPAGGATVPTHLAVHRLGTTQWQIYDHAMASLFYETDVDYLTGGGVDGTVWRLETGGQDGAAPIAWVAETKDYSHVAPESPGGILERKVFFGTKDDVDPNGGTISAAVAIDGTTVHTDSLTSTRVPTLKRLPATAQGYRWRKTWSGTTTVPQKVYGTTVLAVPLKENR